MKVLQKKSLTGTTAAIWHCPKIALLNQFILFLHLPPGAQAGIPLAQTSVSFGLLIIKIRDVIVGVAPVAFGSKVRNAQVIEAREKNQNSDDQDRDGTISSPLADVSSEEERSDDDEKGPNQEQHCGQGDRLVGNFWRALLELQINVPFICASKLRILDFAAWDRSRQIRSGRHLQQQ